jgi:hypothetical protein
MPLTVDLDSIEPDHPQPVLRELLLENRFPVDISTRSLEQLRVATTAESFGALFTVSGDHGGALVHRGEQRVSRTR